MQNRRKFLSNSFAFMAGALSPPVLSAPGPALASRNPLDFKVLDLEVEGDKKLASRFLLFIPSYLSQNQRLPLLILLHGLAETRDVSTGIYAWVERYGLGSAYERLRRPPVARTSKQRYLFSEKHLTTLNTALAADPFRGMAIACPYTPNIARQPNLNTALAAYANWIADVVVPRARQEAPLIIPDAAHTAIDGVSLGGYIAMEVFIRRPEVFGFVGGVQSAYKVGRVSTYADKLAAAFGKNPQVRVHLETSESDSYLKINQNLSGLLRQKSVAHELVVLPGVHDQEFLREAGTLEMLRWYDRAMR